MTVLQMILLILFVAAGAFTVVMPSLLHSAIGLAATSVILSVIIYQLNAPFAAVFELSVCAGLITVVFVSAISLTRRPTIGEETEEGKRHLRHFLPVPLLVLLTAAVIVLSGVYFTLPRALQSFASLGPREALWETRRYDLVGQLLVLLSGIFGVVVLFKAWAQKDGAHE